MDATPGRGQHWHEWHAFYPLPVVITRRARKSEATRARIFQAAIELIAERGLADVTVGQITERADVAKGTFFHHFPSKEAVLTDFGGRLVGALCEALGSGALAGPPRERVLGALRTLAEADGLTPELARALWVAALRAPRPEELHGPNIWGLVGAFAELVREGQAAGDLRADVDPTEAARFLLGQYFLASLEWCSGFAEGDLPALTERYGRLALAGLAAPPAALNGRRPRGAALSDSASPGGPSRSRP